MKKLFYFPVFILFIFLLTLTTTVQTAQVHRVAPGEIVYNIARNYGVTIPEIVYLNNLPDSEQIFIGQVLIIPRVESDYLYRVRSGDTLFRISRRLGLSLNILIQSNNLTDINNLYVRQPLYIPPQSQTYEIQPGDSLYLISQKFGISVQDLVNANNHLQNESMIEVGQHLLIPNPQTQLPDRPNLRELFAGTYYLSGSRQQRKVTLTFDDGPDDVYTPQILDVLKEHNIQATFFVIGSRVERYPEVTRRIVEEGHIIANHTWHHPNLNNVSAERLYNEVQQTEDIIYETINLRTKIIRPPYGAVSVATLERLRELDYKVINWSVDSVDWRDRNVDQILINSLPGVSPGAIILFHSAGGAGQSLQATVAALPDLIYTLRVLNYQFVNLDQLLNIEAYK